MSPDKLFENFFDSPRITNDRIAAFAADTLNRVACLDVAGRYAALAGRISAARQALGQQITGLDQHVNNRMGKTGQVMRATQVFREQMSELEGAIAYALGGRGTEAYLEFYPAGITEYWNARMAALSTLLDRVYQAAGNYKDKLGPDLTAQLQSFRDAWHKERDLQEQAKGSVSGSRAGRNSARHTLEYSLLVLVYTVALDHAENPEAGKAWFDFTLLEPAAHPSLRRHKEDTGDKPDD